MSLETPNPPGARANRLAREKSPYLLQHQYNPVDWHPWGEAAFEKARAEAKPIFLSIGYSTCHWCHVMERESFENDQIAAILNRHFVSIKVDREERPDVDRIYMTFVQATTGQGGWPLNVFLTPELKPFFGGTYFPPETRQGRTAFPRLLEQIHHLWTTRRADLVQSAGDLHQRLAATAQAAPAPGELDARGIIQHAGARLKERYDTRHGGFGGAPKFPQPSHPRFLLQYARRCRDPEAARLALHTCDRMAAGGIHDQLGGGFARYSVDAEWLVPHFEKMLYDNAQLAELYLDAFLISGDARHAAIARDILGYVLRDLTDPEGGFYSAEDADSEGHEGKFYCWTQRELSELLTPEEFRVATRYYGITAAGNFMDHSHPAPLTGQNVLRIADPDAPPADEQLLEAARAKMLRARAGRARPRLDDKILASWNGLMLGALARASAVLSEAKYLAAAERNLQFLRARLWDEREGALYHRWRDGERDSTQLLSGYAFLLSGVLGLYEATLDPGHLRFAIALAEGLLGRFYDREHGGFWQATGDQSDLILRMKDDYDGAEPSGNSVATLGLLRLGRIAGREDYLEAARRTLRGAAARLSQTPEAVPALLSALDFEAEEPRRVVISGEPGSALTSALVRAAHQVYCPDKVVLGLAGPVESFARSLPPEPTAAYLCAGLACQPPETDPEAVKRALAIGGASGWRA